MTVAGQELEEFDGGCVDVASGWAYLRACVILVTGCRVRRWVLGEKCFCNFIRVNDNAKGGCKKERKLFKRSDFACQT